MTPRQSTIFFFISFCVCFYIHSNDQVLSIVTNLNDSLILVKYFTLFLNKLHAVSNYLNQMFAENVEKFSTFPEKTRKVNHAPFCSYKS